MPTFRINQGVNAGNAETLTSSRIIIGRSPDCGLILADDGIDIAHASIEARADKWILQDLGTPGGTWLNEQPVYGPRYVSTGDIIRLNGVQIEFESTVDDWRQIRAVPRNGSTSSQLPELLDATNRPGTLLYAIVGLGALIIILTSLILLIGF